MRCGFHSEVKGRMLMTTDRLLTRMVAVVNGPNGDTVILISRNHCVSSAFYQSHANNPHTYHEFHRLYKHCLKVDPKRPRFAANF